MLSDVHVRARLIAVAGAAWAALTLLLTWQALRGQPLTAPDTATLTAAAALVAALVVVVLRGAQPLPSTSPEHR